MHLEDRYLSIAFLISLFFFLTAPLFYAYPLLYFSPFLIMVIYQHSILASVSIAISIGALVDLFSNYSHFGIHAASYASAVIILYRQKQQFFADRLSTLPVMTFFFSVISSLMQASLLYLLENENVFSGEWIWTDLFTMSAIDAIYAFFVFIFPLLLFGKRPRKASEYFL